MKPWHVNLTLGLLWLVLFRYCQLHSYADSSSFFFDPSNAYTQSYSAVRELEAESFLLKASTTTNIPHTKPTGDEAGKFLCIGVPSLQREREQFLDKTVASLVDTLQPEERELIHIVVLLADRDPEDNPAFSQPWLNVIADEVLVYGDDLRPSTTGAYRQVPWDLPDHPREDVRNERVHLDYAVLFEACREQGAEYFLLAEDDVITSRDWFGRIRAALPEVEAQASRQGKEWLYLRLFYAESYMGWNSEEWPTYLRRSLTVYSAAVGLLWLTRWWWFRLVSVPGQKDDDDDSSFNKNSAKLLPMHRRSQIASFNLTAAAVLGFWLPAFIALYFMAGRLLVDPQRAGVQEMPKYGCCAQGLVFPSRHLSMLEQRLRTPPYDLAGDSFIEHVADEGGFLKWAVVPSVLQHVGVRCSSAKEAYRKTTFNFSFERVYAMVRR